MYKHYNSFKNSNKKESNSDWYEVGLYNGYVDGVTETLGRLDSICIPATFTKGQSFDMVGKFLEDNPAERNKSAAVLIYAVMFSAFPCEE
ncbi:MAG: hypothetical protein ACI9MS_003513 [Glaciecola sp.]